MATLVKILFMTDINATSEVLDFAEGQKPALPSGLNILTILTFIGCGIGLLFVLGTPAINKFMLSMMDKASASGQDLTAKQITDMQKGRAAIEAAQANIVPLMIIALVSIILCFVGALWMRKLKKEGFWIYTAGEILPLIANFILMGAAQYTGVMSVVLGIGIPVLFVVLYAMQRKYLINK